MSEFERELNGEPDDNFTQRLNREEVPLSEMDADLEDFFKDDMADDLFADPGVGSGNGFPQNSAAPEPMTDFGPAAMDDPVTMSMNDLDPVTMTMDDLDPVTMAMDDSDSVTMAIDDTEPAAMGMDGLDAVTMAMDTEPPTMAVSDSAGALDSPELPVHLAGRKAPHRGRHRLPSARVRRGGPLRIGVHLPGGIGQEKWGHRLVFWSAEPGNHTKIRIETMLEFQPLTLGDLPRLRDFFKYSGGRICDTTPAPCLCGGICTGRNTPSVTARSTSR